MPVQTSYAAEQPIGFEGDVADGFMEQSITSGANEVIPFGRIVAFANDSGKYAKLPSANSFTLNGDYVALNVINGTVTVKTIDPVTGLEVVTVTAITPVTFLTDHLTTVNLVAAAIDAVANVASVVVSDANNRTITANGVDGAVVILSGFITTLGVSMPTYAYSTSDMVQGVSLRITKEPDSDGNCRFNPKDTMPIAKEVHVWIYTEEAVTVNDTPYVRFVDSGGLNQGRGQIRKSAGSVAVLLSGAKFLTSASANGLVKLALKIS